MSFPRYEKYKDSGVEWLGEVPEGWEVSKLRRFLIEHRQGYYTTNPYVETGVKLLRITDLREYGEVSFDDCPQVEEVEEIAPFLLINDDFVFARTGGAGAFGLIQNIVIPVAYASYLIRFRFYRKCNAFFLRYFFLSSCFQDSLKQNIHGGVNQNVHAEDIKDQHVALPLPYEQSAIVAFLNRETGKIDALVAEQERLIELLKEKRQAVISHAVTKGLNPDAPMKDSGIEWLGEVPEGWEVISIKWLSPVQRGASPRPIEDPKYFDDNGEYAWVRIADVSASDGKLRETTQQLSELGSSLSVKLQPGDLFVSIAGTVGKPCIAQMKACIHDGFVYFPRLTVDALFLYRIFEAGVCYQGLGKFGTQLNLNTDTIGSIRIALPPKEELQQILSFVNRETAKIDTLITEAQQVIGLLKERRSALISAAVTGKIDVRGLSA